MYRRIDALVYELYGLTKEEIGIVEGSTKKWTVKRLGDLFFPVFTTIISGRRHSGWYFSIARQ